MALRNSLRALSLAALIVASGCVEPDPRSTPERAAKAFLESLERIELSSARRRFYMLIDEKSRASLDARARMAESLSHRPFRGPDMIVPTKSIFRFKPVPIRREDIKVEGDRATLTLRGEAPGARAELKLVREEEGWVILLGLDALDQSS